MLNRFLIFFLILIPLFVPIFTLNAKSLLLKNGRKIENVNVKIVSSGFEVRYKDGKIERFSLQEVQKVHFSDSIPEKNSPVVLNQNKSKNSFQKSENKNPKEKEELVKPLSPNPNEESVRSSEPKQKSKIAVVAEGLIPGWSRLVRSDSNAWKGAGFFFMAAELFFAYKSYVYLKAPTPALESNLPPSRETIIALASRDSNLIGLSFANSIYSNSQKVVVSDGTVMERDRYVQERQMYVSAFVFVLIFDAFLGYRHEFGSVVPSFNVSFQHKEVSGGITIRF
ncbi:LA_0442/LA_0875 N-terminal domain-containing protein [Leptospira yasudae]|uniref:DNA-binding protein n=1 Tax=Leptospira yasudae TaxID=2202201 RepID=A0A6N4QTK0_9LEPT|nr:DNA-binding protein [Leptospira yasudae]TGL77633.1 DNA-binding protein [Leptospira yasudae]TGL82752.1 DNA-binding protein [Leptospira yasudae]TGL86092.1 DNA-binding protein [Leptospira yasudae]